MQGAESCPRLLAGPRPGLNTRSPAPPAALGEQLSCLAPWLDSLPDPAALSAAILAANASVGGVLRPRLADLGAQLSGLAAALDPAAGRYGAALQEAAGLKGSLLDSPAGLIARANVSRQL